MYTQALNTAETDDRGLEDAAKAAQFQARIDAEERIEPNDWMPEAYRRNGTPQVAAFAKAHAERVSFHAWLQFLADRQLGEAAARAGSMRIGLYRDLAVGADRGGSEVWSHPERLWERGA